MAVLIQAALAPVFICIIYVYIRDKYEKEPYSMLFLGLLYGVYSTFVILMLARAFENFFPHEGTMGAVLFNAFISSSAIEEGTKYGFLFLLIWRNKNFNEPFDGIVYAVFISLGFAMLENVIYIFDSELGGIETAINRAVFSVPGHGFFGVAMGYYFALAKYNEYKKAKYLVLTFIVPFLFHGVYNFILLLNLKWYLMAVMPVVVYLWVSGFQKMKYYNEISPFKK